MSVKSRVEKIEKVLRKEARAEEEDVFYINTIADLIIAADIDDGDENPLTKGKKVVYNNPDLEAMVKSVAAKEEAREAEGSENGKEM